MEPFQNAIIYSAIHHNFQCDGNQKSTTIASADIISSTNVNVKTEGKSSLFGASFNFINSIVGAGIIGIPFALKVLLNFLISN